MTRIVAIGGTVNPNSGTEQALGVVAGMISEAGCEVEIFGGAYLAALPHYRGSAHKPGDGRELVEAVRQAHGLVIAAPGYHGTISGLVKNGLDFLEDLARDERAYLDGRAVGLIATAYGGQAAMSTMLTLRTIVHALRGWPTPLGATILTHAGLFSAEGECLDAQAAEQLRLVAEQVVFGARSFAAATGR